MKVELTREQKERSLVLKGQVCPSCGHRMDRTICVDEPDRVPREGDFTFCIRCKQPSKYDLALNMVNLNTEEKKILEKTLKERGLQ